MWCKKATTSEGKEKRLDKRSTMVSTIKVSASICLKYVQLVRKKWVASETTTANRLISIMIKMDTIWGNLHGSVLCWGTTTTSYVGYEHNQCTLLKYNRSKFKMMYNMLGNWSILGISTTDYYVMRLRKTSQVLKSLLHLANF